MDTKCDGYEIHYQERCEFIKSIFAWNLFLIAVIMLFIKKWELYNMILQVIKLLVVITLLIFITHSDNINPKPIQKIVKINIIIMISVFVLQLVPLVDLNLINNLLSFSAENNDVDQGSIYLYILYYILSKYKYKNSRSIIIEYKIILTIIILLNLLSNFWFENNITILIVYNIIVEIMLFMAIKNTFKEKLIVNKKINIFKVNIIVCFICVNTMKILEIFNFNIIYSFVEAIKFAVFIVFITEIINNIAKNMYSFIFKDIHSINKRLEEINYEIIIRNEELEKSEIEIEKKQKKYRNLLNSLSKAIIIVSTANNRIMYCNADFQKLIEVNNIRKILNKKIQNVVNLYFNYEDLNNLNREELYFGNTILNNGKQLEIRLSNYSKNKEEITMIFEDITEKIKIEKIKGEIERKKINDNIKKNFLSNVSHDFKIPINVIYSATQLENLLITNNDIEGVKKYNSISKQNCLTLIKLTNNIIDISKISSEYVNPILTLGNIVEFIEDRVASLVEYAKLKKINIIFDTDEEEVYMKYDGELMERIILNLVSNAIKFTPEQGYINISVNNNEENIFISVEDTGSGMDEKFAKQAFDKYSMKLQASYANVQGTGVGLYVVYNLVNLQKGEIWVDSKLGKGSKFTMKFCKE